MGRAALQGRVRHRGGPWGGGGPGRRRCRCCRAGRRGAAQRQWLARPASWRNSQGGPPRLCAGGAKQSACCLVQERTARCAPNPPVAAQARTATHDSTPSRPPPRARAQGLPAKRAHQTQPRRAARAAAGALGQACAGRPRVGRGAAARRPGSLGRLSAPLLREPGPRRACGAARVAGPAGTGGGGRGAAGGGGGLRAAAVCAGGDQEHGPGGRASLGPSFGICRLLLWFEIVAM
jgi:hypothetical protein